MPAPRPSKRRKASSSKRKARKEEDAPAALDVYSYAEPKDRRRNTSGALLGRGGKAKPGRKQQESEAEDSDGDEEEELDGIVEFTGVKPKGFRILGDANEEAEEMDEDDEDINSDFDSASSEDESEAPAKGKSAVKQGKRKAIDLAESSDSDSDDSEGYVDALGMLDAHPDSGSESEGDEANEQLNSFIAGLKRPTEEDKAPAKKKARVERTEVLPEGDFTALTSGSGKLSIADLLAPLSTSSLSNDTLAGLKKSLKTLAPSASSKTGLQQSGPLSAPLPGRLQDQLDRQSAFGQTKQETDKWNETVRLTAGTSSGVSKRGMTGARKADTLSFPLAYGGGQEGQATAGPSSAAWSAKFQPGNSLESQVANLLSQHQEAGVAAREAAQLKELSPADLEARQAQLRAQRELLFRAERKAKRVAKIKSKAFRKIARRAAAKQREENGEGEVADLEMLAEMDELDGGSRVSAERLRRETARAEERITLKHSTRRGKGSYAQKMREGDMIKGLEGNERDAALREMVAREQLLRQKIAGPSGAGSDSESDSEEEDSDNEDPNERAVKQIDRLAQDKEDTEEQKGVMGMKFMRDAMARRAREVDEDAAELRRTLAGEADFSDDEDEEGGAVSSKVDGNTGRMVFGPKATEKGMELKKVERNEAVRFADGLEDEELEDEDEAPTQQRQSEQEEANPWLSQAASSSKQSRKMNLATRSGNDSVQSKVETKLSRTKKGTKEAREAAAEDARIELDLLEEPAPSKRSEKNKRKKEKRRAAAATAAPATSHQANADSEDDDSDDADEDASGRGGALLANGKNKVQQQQRELVKAAFAGDDVVRDFEEEKRKEVERDAPTERDDTLPGWGAWGGKGAKKSKKKFITSIPGIDAASRKDAQLKHVIISEKRDRRAAKYALKDLPFPYTSAGQLEQKLATPLGKEWNTETVLRDRTTPSVLIKPGAAIRPVARKL